MSEIPVIGKNYVDNADIPEDYQNNPDLYRYELTDAVGSYLSNRMLLASQNGEDLTADQVKAELEDFGMDSPRTKL